LENKEFQLGDVVQMKKAHPCGANEWEVIRLGMDIRMKCVQCGRSVMLPRAEFTRGMRKVLRRKDGGA
jgi:hypothetical protein